VPEPLNEMGQPVGHYELAALAARVVSGLGAAGFRLNLAESLTGGMIANALVGVPGASRVLVAGVVAYHDSAKAQILGVGGGVLEQFGAVSEQCAEAMASGARTLVSPAGVASNKLFGLSTTGVAGPDLQEGKPVGQVHVAVATDAACTVRSFRFDGDRTQIREQAAIAALNLLLEEIGY